MKLKERPFNIAGKVTINTFRAGMVDLALPALQELQAYRTLLAQNRDDAHLRYYFQGAITRLKEQIANIRAAHFIRTAAENSNIVVDSPGYGLDLIIQRLTGINTYSLNITFIEIGTGNTTPTVNDIALTSPSLRAAVSFQEDYAATNAIIQAYITDANLPNATYNEVGSFVDGSSTIGTGQLFNHALISPAYTKVSGEDTTVEIDFTVSNS